MHRQPCHLYHRQGVWRDSIRVVYGIAGVETVLRAEVLVDAHICNMGKLGCIEAGDEIAVYALASCGRQRRIKSGVVLSDRAYGRDGDYVVRVRGMSQCIVNRGCGIGKIPELRQAVARYSAQLTSRRYRGLLCHALDPPEALVIGEEKGLVFP